MFPSVQFFDLSFFVTGSAVHFSTSSSRFVRIFWHTLRLKIDGIEVPLTFVSENELLFNQSSSTDSLDTTSFRVAVTPSEDRKMPSLLQLHFPLLPHAASAKLTMSFEKAFLRLPVPNPNILQFDEIFHRLTIVLWHFHLP